MIMKRFATETVGCRLNQYETEKIAAQLEKLGLHRVPFTEPADLYIINTCTVTGRADATCRNYISRVARHYPEARLAVVGCYVEADPDRVGALPGVDLMVGTGDKDRFVTIIRDRYPELFDTAETPSLPAAVTDFYVHNRAWIKISDGCNQRCAYCIIPLVRGPLKNRPAVEIADEIRTLSGNGFNEVVLTGVHIGKYRDDGLSSFADLLRYLLDNTDIWRIRISSIEPQEVTADLLRVFAEAGKRLCRHLHLPLQAGSDRVLKLMRRPYDSRRYLNIARTVREKIDGVVIGADVIVGFPGETDDDFAGSVAVADSGLLDYLHAFSYSDRPGTLSSEMPGKIKPDIIKKRNRILREISHRRYAEALRRALGHTFDAISEYRYDRDRGTYFGMTDNYLRIRIPDTLGGGKELLKFKAIGATDDYLTGEIIGD